MLVQIIIIALVLYLLRGGLIEGYSAGSTCESCTLYENRFPPFSSKSMLLPYPRYEFSYAPDFLHRQQLEIINSQLSCADSCKDNKVVSVPSTCELDTNFGIMPTHQYFYVKNRMGGCNKPLYSKLPLGIPTDGSVQSVSIPPSF